jgi:methyl-accepting chemotaxis protein
MSFLSRFRVLTKILAVVILMGAIAGTITWLGITSLKSLSDATDRMEAEASRALVAGHIYQNVTALNRAEYSLGVDPRAENRTQTRKYVDEKIKLLQDQLAELGNTDDAQAKQLLQAIHEHWKKYQPQIEDTFSKAQAVKNFQMTDEMQKLRDSIESSHAQAEKLQDAARSVADRLRKRVHELSDDANNEYLQVSRLMIIASAIGIVVGLAMGFMIGQFGIAKPMRGLVGLLQRMAKGEEVEIDGIDRKDEIGETGRAVNEIKEMLAEKARQEAEAKAEQDRRAAAEQEAAMQKMAAEFETAVGGIVKAAVAGDFSQRVDLNGKTGMVLNVGTAINSLCENVATALGDLVQMLNSLADGNLTQRITKEYQGSFAALKDNANKTAEKIGTTISEIKASAREVTNASAEISTSTTDLSQRTEEQAASLEETSASMEEISATVKKNADNAQQANQSAATTRAVAERGGEVVAQAVSAMARIEESAGKISDIIGVIDEIARQTNLLALNAAVEAARAGEAGRGFAVVASEVRSLAQRSSQAAKDIKDLIINSNGQVKEGVDLVNKAGSSLTEIVASIKTVADLVSDIANASVEQSSGIEQVGKALTQMDEVTQQNSALVEENAATAKTLEHQAKVMDERVAAFRLADHAVPKIETAHAAPLVPAKPTSARPIALAPSRGPAARRAPAARAVNGHAPAAVVNGDAEWTEF